MKKSTLNWLFQLFSLCVLFTSFIGFLLILFYFPLMARFCFSQVLLLFCPSVLPFFSLSVVLSISYSGLPFFHSSFLTFFCSCSYWSSFLIFFSGKFSPLSKRVRPSVFQFVHRTLCRSVRQSFRSS